MMKAAKIFFSILFEILGNRKAPIIAPTAPKGISHRLESSVILPFKKYINELIAVSGRTMLIAVA